MKSETKFFIIFFVTFLVLCKIANSSKPTYAASSGTSQSDEQLIARAINGEARGESYEGQVAVRCCYFK